MSVESTAQIEQRAAEWLARRDGNHWCARQEAELDAWLDERLEHRVAWLRLLDSWEAASRLRALGAGVQSDRPPPPGHWNLSPFFEPPQAPARTRPATTTRALTALAAGLAVAAVITLVWRSGPQTVHETAVGGMESVPMADGSRVILNTDSRIKVAVNDSERRVTLDHGEAFFQVAPDPLRPFVVAAGERRVVAVGTAFSVRREKQDIQVVVTEGAVRVEQGPEAKLLTAGSIARAGGATLTVHAGAVSEAEERVAWRSGNVVFRNVSLAEAVAEFNRYNSRKILIEDPAAAAYTVGGSFGATNIDAFVRLLERAYPLRAEFRREAIVLTAR